MSPVSVFLLVIAAIFLIAIVAEEVFERTGIPDVVWLIGVGLLLGPATDTVTRAQLIAVAPYFGALTLVVVLFDGGSELRLVELSRVAVRGLLLALRDSAPWSRRSPCSRLASRSSSAVSGRAAIRRAAAPDRRRRSSRPGRSTPRLDRR